MSSQGDIIGTTLTGKRDLVFLKSYLCLRFSHAFTRDRDILRMHHDSHMCFFFKSSPDDPYLSACLRHQRQVHKQFLLYITNPTWDPTFFRPDTTFDIDQHTTATWTRKSRPHMPDDAPDTLRSSRCLGSLWHL